MKIILKVARTELRTLFYSPIAWFLMIVFMIQSGISFFGQMEMVARQIEITGGKQEFYGSITDSVFLGQMGMFNNVMGSLYLYIPLLTMSLISREISSGTIRLLYSSPVRIYEIVLGKYIAMMVYSLVLVLIVGIFLVSGMVNIQHAETGMLLSALFGFYLLLCAYSAIGLFMSCLTSYQVVAAISTFVMIGILSYIGTVWQDVDFVRTLTYYLSINGRAQKLLAGLITTREVLYFFIIVYIFLGLSIFKLKAGMESRSRTVKTMRYLAVVASALVIGYISSIPGLIGYWDATFNKSRTLTPRVQQIVKNLRDAPLKVTAYANLIERNYYLGAPTYYNSYKARWEPYFRFNQNIILDKVMYYDTVPSPEFAKRNAGKSTKDLAHQYSRIMNIDLKEMLTPEQIRKQIDLSGEGNRYVMKLQWKDRTTFLRVFDDIFVWPSETEVAAALLRLQQATLPKIAFVNSELEREAGKSGDRDYEILTNRPSFRHSLINQGFDVMSISLESDSIPADISALVIADPRTGLSLEAMKKLKKYTGDGGNLLISGEPGKQVVLNPFLKELGVQLNEGMILQESANDAPDFISAFVDKKAGAFYKPLEYVIEDSLKLTMPGAIGISYSNDGPFTIQPLATTDGRTSWSHHKPLDLATITRASILQPVTSHRDSLGTIFFSEPDGDVRGPVPTVVALSRKINGKEQHIVVAGDADFLSNKELSRPQRTANFIFSTSLFRWITARGFPIDTSRPEPRDKKVDTTLDQLKLQRIICLWVLPALLALFASILLIRRKRK
jgi:ABC-2 type transport system permease protein